MESDDLPGSPPFPPSTSPSSEPLELARLFLPELSPDLDLSEHAFAMDMRPDPPSSRSSLIFGRDHSVPSPRHFSTDYRRGVLEIDLILGDRHFNVFVLKDYLIEKVDEFESGLPSWGPVVMREELDWDNGWGLKACRIFETIPPSRQWVSFITEHLALLQGTC